MSDFKVDEIIVSEDFSNKNKKIQDDLLKPGRPRGAPKYRQQVLRSMHKQIKKLLVKGENLTRIAQQINCSRSTLLRYVRNNLENTDA